MVYEHDEAPDPYEPEIIEPAEPRELAAQRQQAPTLLPTEAFGPHTLERAEEKRKILEGLKLLGIRSTSPRDWCRMGDLPYLTESGCMKFAEIYGVCFSDLRVEPCNYNDERGPVIEFYAFVTASYQNRFDSESGSASTAEVLFNGKGQDGKPRRLPLSEINRTNVRKKAITNAKARATKKLLGLTFSWAEVKRELSSVGKDPDEIPGITYGDRSTGSGGSSTANGKGVLTPTKKELANMLFEMAGEDKELAANMLEKYTAFKGRDGNMVAGKRSVRDLSDKQATVTLRIVTKEYQNFQAEQLAGGGEEVA
jgi:hypothetical protein